MSTGHDELGWCGLPKKWATILIFLVTFSLWLQMANYTSTWSYQQPAAGQPRCSSSRNTTGNVSMTTSQNMSSATKVATTVPVSKTKTTEFGLKPQAKPNTKPKTKYQDVVCDGCFVRNYKFLNRPVNACGNSSTSPPGITMVIAVMSGATERLQRDVIRATWVSCTRNNTAPTMRHVFLLGAVKDKHQQDLIDVESRKYNDIVQQSFLDKYDNLALKMLMMLDWATQDCSNARFIFKADSDLFVNAHNVINVIESAKSDDHLMGQCPLTSSPIRNLDSKWSMTPQQFPQSSYPPFCLGPRYVVPMRVARAVLAVAPDTPPIRLEDVYLGMLLHKTKYTVKKLDNIDAGGSAITSRGGRCDAIKKTVTKHSIRSVSLSQIWKKCFSTGYR